MQCSSGRYLRGAVSPNLHTLRPLLRGGSGLVSLPNSPNYAVFQRPLPQFHQVIDLTGAQTQSCSVQAAITSVPPTNRSYGGQTQSCTVPAAVTSGVPSLLTFIPCGRFGTAGGALKIPTPSYLLAVPQECGRWLRAGSGLVSLRSFLRSAVSPNLHTLRTFLKSAAVGFAGGLI